MKANELRVGNWYKQLSTGYFTQVSLFLLGEIADDESYLDYIQPIPTTPEILEKSGFVKDNNSHYGGYLIPISDVENIRIIKDESGWHWPIYGYRKANVHFLHQLQNLYFSLVGEELNVTF